MNLTTLTIITIIITLLVAFIWITIMPKIGKIICTALGSCLLIFTIVFWVLNGIGHYSYVYENENILESYTVLSEKIEPIFNDDKSKVEQLVFTQKSGEIMTLDCKNAIVKNQEHIIEEVIVSEVIFKREFPLGIYNYVSITKILY